MLLGPRPGEGIQLLAVFRPALNLGEPLDSGPGAGMDDHRNHPQALALAAEKKLRDLFAADELGGEEVRRDQEHGGPGLGHGRFDLGQPVVARVDPAIVPDLQIPFELEHPELLDEAVLPGFVLVVVADEDRRAGGGGVHRDRVFRGSLRFYRAGGRYPSEPSPHCPDGRKTRGTVPLKGRGLYLAGRGVSLEGRGLYLEGRGRYLEGRRRSLAGKGRYLVGRGL